MKTTALHEIPELADKFPILAVEGTVKVAMEVKHSPPEAEKSWSRQFFVLAQGNDEVGCTMWDAEGSEMVQGEHVRIEATQNKKKQWTGLTKGSYQKNGEVKHTIEIRANNVKITNLDGGDEHGVREVEESGGGSTFQRDPDWPEAPVAAPESTPARSNGDSGVMEARKHIMQSANLYCLCVACVEKVIAPALPQIAQTSEQFQAAVGTLFIEASRAGYVAKMPSKPL